MALPALPADNTPRYFIDYTSMEIQHTVQIRFAQQLTDVASTFNELLTAMVGCMLLRDTITGIRFAQKGSDVSFPVLPGPFPGTLSNASAISDDPESVFISAPFRGYPTGRKGRVEFFFPSSIVPLDLNNRFPTGSVEALGNLEEALTHLTQPGSGNPAMVAIDNSGVIFNQYWNRAKSAYWQRRQRLG